MESSLRRIREIIISECHLNQIENEHIQDGYEHAEFLFEQGRNIASSVIAGIEVAKGQQRRQNNFKRSILKDGAF